MTGIISIFCECCCVSCQVSFCCPFSKALARQQCQVLGQCLPVLTSGFLADFFFARCRHWCSLWIRMSPLFFIAILLTYLGLEAKMYNFLFFKKEPYWEIIHIPYNSSLWSVQRIHRLVQLSPQFWVMFMIPRETLYPLAITPQFPRPPPPSPRKPQICFLSL